MLILPLPQQIEAINIKRMSSIKIGNHLPGLALAPTNELAVLWVPCKLQLMESQIEFKTKIKILEIGGCSGLYTKFQIVLSVLIAFSILIIPNYTIPIRRDHYPCLVFEGIFNRNTVVVGQVLDYILLLLPCDHLKCA